MAQAGSAAEVPGRSAWPELIGLGLFLAATAGFVWWCAHSDVGVLHLVVGVLLALSLAILARAGLVRLVGPVLIYDVIRNARRSRFILVRWLYALFLLALLFWVHSAWLFEARITGQFDSQNRALARLAEQYFLTFSLTQFVCVMLLTPAYVAGAIAEEKDRKTLEFLLATDLENREIVLGKLISRIGNLVLFVLTGLPILSLMQIFGGIDPTLLLSIFAATGATILGLSGLAIFNSVSRRRARDAIATTYLAMIGYLALTGVTATIRLTLTSAGYSLSWLSIDWNWLFDAFQAGNPIFGIVEIARTIAFNGPLPVVVRDELTKYAIFHVVLAAITVTWSIVRIRAVALRQSAVMAVKPRSRTVRRRRARPIGLQPMLWKELWIEGRLRFNWLGRISLALLILGGFVPIILVFIVEVIDPANLHRGQSLAQQMDAIFTQLTQKWTTLSQAVNYWLRIMNVLISLLMLLGVAVRAAGSIGAERDRDTLTSLLATPLTTREILGAKWLGALWSVRGLGCWLLSVWLIAMLLGGVVPFVLPLHLAAWLAPAACFASIGLWFSAVCRTTLRAIAWTVAAAILAGGGHWLCLGMCCYTPIGLLGASGFDSMKWLLYAELAVTPPFVFGWDACWRIDELSLGRDNSMVGWVIGGIVFWCVLALAIWEAAHAKFALLTCRRVGPRPGTPSVAPAE